MKAVTREYDTTVIFSNLTIYYIINYEFTEKYLPQLIVPEHYQLWLSVPGVVYQVG